MSQARISFASPAAIRVAWMSSGLSAMRTCETTAPFFCASPVMSSTLTALAFEMRGHAEQRADRDDAGAADAGDDDAVRLGRGGRRRIRQRRKLAGLRLLRLAQSAAFDGDEARAEAVDAGEVLVARALVDRALAPELGLERAPPTRSSISTPQSPQPSQTSSLMKTRFAGSGYLPRLRRRRFSAAHVWSYSRIVQPSVSRSERWTASRSSRWWISMSAAK